MPTATLTDKQLQTLARVYAFILALPDPDDTSEEMHTNSTKEAGSYSNDTDTEVQDESNEQSHLASGTLRR